MKKILLESWLNLPLKEVGMPSTPNVDPVRYPAETFELYSVPSFSCSAPEVLPGSNIGSTKQSVEPNDVLLCKIVPHINRVWKVAPKGLNRQIASGEWIVIRSSIGDPDYLRYALSEPAFRQVFLSNVSGVGGSLMRARPKAVAEIQIGIPPLPEQKRIVAKLDALMTYSTRARDELAHIPRLIERYKQAVLAAAFRGELTADWRGTEELVGWKEFLLENLVQEGPTNSYSPQASEDGQGTLSLKLTATTRGILDLSPKAVKRLNESIPPNAKYWLRKGDILVQRANSLEYVGATAIFDGPEQTYIYPDLMMRIRVSSNSLGTYLWRYLNSDIARQYFQSNATGTAGNMPKINGKVLKSTPIPLPPANGMDELLRLVDNSMSAINTIYFELAQAQRLRTRLEQATLAKAFRGELVPQDPNDEPASVLLERIRSQVGDTKQRGRKKVQK